MNFKIPKKTIYYAFCAVALIFATVLTISVIIDNDRAVIGDVENEISTSGNGGEKIFLLLGKDRVSGLTDVMMLVSLDTEDNRADIVQIPRDTYARYSSGSYRKLNGAMAALGGPSELCAFLSEAMSIEIDGYVLFDLDAFVKVVDAIGGVEIELPFDMDYNDPYQDLSIHLDAGKQILDGAAAEKFVRYRSGYIRGDIARLDAQKLFMSAFIKKITESVEPSELVKLIMTVKDDISTDLGFIEICDIAMKSLDIDTGNISMTTLSGSDIRSESSGAWYYVISKKATLRILSNVLGRQIDEKDFDKNKVFLNPSVEEFEKIYNSDMPYSSSDASDINENGIIIQKQ